MAFRAHEGGGREITLEGLEPSHGVGGTVVHRWTRCHRDQPGGAKDPVKTDDKFVPIAEAGVIDAGILVQISTL